MLKFFFRRTEFNTLAPFQFLKLEEKKKKSTCDIIRLFLVKI